MLMPLHLWGKEPLLLGSMVSFAQTPRSPTLGWSRGVFGELDWGRGFPPPQDATALCLGAGSIAASILKVPFEGRHSFQPFCGVRSLLTPSPLLNLEQQSWV